MAADFGTNSSVSSAATSAATEKGAQQLCTEGDLRHSGISSGTAHQLPPGSHNQRPTNSQQHKDQSISSKTSSRAESSLQQTVNAVQSTLLDNYKNSSTAGSSLNTKSYNNHFSSAKTYNQPLPIKTLPPNYTSRTGAGINNLTSYKRPTEVIISQNQTTDSNLFKSSSISNDSSNLSGQYIKPLSLNWKDSTGYNSLNRYGSLKSRRPARESRVLSLEDLELSLQEELNSLKAVKNSASKFPISDSSSKREKDDAVQLVQSKEDRDITSLSSLLSQIDEFVTSNCVNLLDFEKSNLAIARNSFNNNRKISEEEYNFALSNEAHFIDPLTLGALATFGSKPHKRSKSEDFLLDQSLSIAPTKKDSINSNLESNISELTTTTISESGNFSPPKTKLQKFPSEHSTEVRTPQSEVALNQLNSTELIFNSETPPLNVNSVADDLDPIPKFPVEFNFDDILEAKLEDFQFLDHDYSVPEPHSPVNAVDSSDPNNQNQPEMPFISRLGFSKNSSSQNSQNNSRTSDGVAPISWRDVDPHTNYQKSMASSNPYSNNMSHSGSFTSRGGLERPNLYGPRGYQRRNDPLSYHNVVKERFSPSPTDRSQQNVNPNSFFAPSPTDRGQITNPNFFAGSNLVLNTRSPSSDDIAKRNRDIELMRGYGNFIEATSPNAYLTPLDTRQMVNGGNYGRNPEPAFDQQGNFIPASATWRNENNGGIIPWDLRNQHDQVSNGTNTNSNSERTSTNSLSPKQGSFVMTRIDVPDPETTMPPTKQVLPNYPEKQMTTSRNDSRTWSTSSNNSYQIASNNSQQMNNPRPYSEKSESSGSTFKPVKYSDNDDDRINETRTENETISDPNKEKANQLKQDIKHHFSDVTLIKDWPNFNFSRDDAKTAEMYATLRRNRAKNLNSATSVPDISRQKSTDALSTASTDVLNSKGGSLLKGNLDSLRNSMKNLLEGNEDIPLKERKERITNLRSGSLPDITWRAFQKEKSDAFGEPNADTLKKKPTEANVTLPSENGDETMTQGKTQLQIWDKMNGKPTEDNNSTLRRLGATENSLKKVETSNHFDPKQDRPLSPTSVTSWSSSVSKTNQNPSMTHRENTTPFFNAQSNNDIDNFFGQRGNNNFVDENKINEAFRDQTHMGPRQFRSYTFGAKSAISNPGNANPSADSAAQRAHFSSTQNINQYPAINNSSAMTSFNGRPRLGSRSEFLSDVDNYNHQPQQQRVGPLASRSFSARDASSSLMRNSSSRNQTQHGDLGAAQNQSFHARSRSKNTI